MFILFTCLLQIVIPLIIITLIIVSKILFVLVSPPPFFIPTAVFQFSLAASSSVSFNFLTNNLKMTGTCNLTNHSNGQILRLGEKRKLNLTKTTIVIYFLVYYKQRRKYLSWFDKTVWQNHILCILGMSCLWYLIFTYCVDRGD